MRFQRCLKPVLRLEMERCSVSCRSSRHIALRHLQQPAPFVIIGKVPLFLTLNPLHARVGVFLLILLGTNQSRASQGVDYCMRGFHDLCFSLTSLSHRTPRVVRKSRGDPFAKGSSTPVKAILLFAPTVGSE